MSLERNLVAAILAVLLASLAIGAALTYEHAVAKVRTEMQAAMAVGQRIVQNAADDEQSTDPLRRLALIVGDFNGDRHLRAMLRDPRGGATMVSTLQVPAEAAPGPVFDLVGGLPIIAAIDLPPELRKAGTLVLQTDAHNEVSEAWSDLKLELGFLGAFSCVVLALSLRTLRAAFRPMQELCRALATVGTGDYDVKLTFRRYRELVAVQEGFHGMTMRLAEMETQNRVLHTRLQCIQEDERRELARDLHDEVAPFLFAVSADASLIRRFVHERRFEAVGARAEGILASVGHMQKHIRDVLSRLMPDVLLDLGLAGAIDSLVHFWRLRKPDVAFAMVVPEDSGDSRSNAVVFRIVQESLSNAMRHAGASRVEVSVRHTTEGIEVDVIDDGQGLPGPVPHGTGLRGLGLIGMRERVRSIGGALHVGNREDRSGVHVHATLVQNTPSMVLS